MYNERNTGLEAVNVEQVGLSPVDHDDGICDKCKTIHMIMKDTINVAYNIECLLVGPAVVEKETGNINNKKVTCLKDEVDEMFVDARRLQDIIDCILLSLK